MHTPAARLGRMRDEARAIDAKDAAKGVLTAFDRNGLLTYASAIAFQVFFALIPLALFVFGLLGGLGLEEVWSREVVPDLRDSTSPAAFTVIDDTVDQVLGEQQVFWMTIGAVITVWKMSGATRAIMDAFDGIYECRRERSTRERYVRSILLSLATGLLILSTVALYHFGPSLGPLGSILRWPLAIVLLSLVMALFVHFAPADAQPVKWAGFGSALVIVAWLGTSLAFAFYVTSVADYGSIFGALATIFIALEYLFLAAVAFLAGAQVDALVRERLEP
jgi:membrane protein